MFVDTPNTDWGAWVLGDAPHVLDMACSSVGHGIEVVLASVRLPRDDQALPEVQLLLPHNRALNRMRETLLESGFPLAMPDGSEEQRWQAELPGIQLLVRVEDES